jgi:hypothetical protein
MEITTTLLRRRDGCFYPCQPDQMAGRRAFLRESTRKRRFAGNIFLKVACEKEAEYG